MLGPRSLDDFVCGLGDCAGAAFGDQGLHPWIRKSNPQATEHMPKGIYVLGLKPAMCYAVIEVIPVADTDLCHGLDQGLHHRLQSRLQLIQDLRTDL